MSDCFLDNIWCGYSKVEECGDLFYYILFIISKLKVGNSRIGYSNRDIMSVID